MPAWELPIFFVQCATEAAKEHADRTDTEVPACGGLAGVVLVLVPAQLIIKVSGIEGLTVSSIWRKEVAPLRHVKLVTQVESVTFGIGSSPYGFLFHFNELNELSTLEECSVSNI